MTQAASEYSVQGGRGALLATTNRHIDEWGKVLHNPLMTLVAVSRQVDHPIIFERNLFARQVLDENFQYLGICNIPGTSNLRFPKSSCLRCHDGAKTTAPRSSKCLKLRIKRYSCPPISSRFRPARVCSRISSAWVAAMSP